ncbi:MAG: recombinase family protein [Candidatus Aenigmatarchaeota archaeon]
MIAAIYCRVSTEKQEKQETIGSQLAALRDFASKNGYTVYKEYIDDGYSGELLERPGLDQLRDDAKKKLFDTILVYCLDRLARKYIYIGLLQEELKKYGVSIVFLNRPDKKDTPEENLLEGIQGLIAEYEKAKILERTRRGKLHRAKSGQLVTSIPPYGYNYIREEKRYELNEAEATTVKMIFHMFVQKNYTLRKIAKELTGLGIPPRKGKVWRHNSVHKILTNETYTGITYYNKNYSVETEGKGNYRRHKNTGRKLRPREVWIPIKLPENLIIIDSETFLKAREKLRKNLQLSQRNTKRQYLLRGLLRCGECGSLMYGTPFHGHLFYRCGNRDRTFPHPGTCKASSISAEKIETAVWNAISQAIRDPAILMERLEKIKEDKKKGASLRHEIELLSEEIKAADEMIERVIDAYSMGVLTIEQLKKQMQAMECRKNKLAEKKKELESKQAGLDIPVESIEDFITSFNANLNNIENDFNGKREILVRLVKAITLKKGGVTIQCIIPLTKSNFNIMSILPAHCDLLQQQPRGPS